MNENYTINITIRENCCFILSIANVVPFLVATGRLGKRRIYLCCLNTTSLQGMLVALPLGRRQRHTAVGRWFEMEIYADEKGGKMQVSNNRGRETEIECAEKMA